MSKAVVAAMRQADMPRPHVPSHSNICEDCSAPVWISYGTLEGAIEELSEFDIVCVQCVQARLDK